MYYTAEVLNILASRKNKTKTYLVYSHSLHPKEKERVHVKNSINGKKIHRHLSAMKTCTELVRLSLHSATLHFYNYSTL